MMPRAFDTGSRSGNLLLMLIIFGALGARMLQPLFLPGIAHPDETFQYLEPAYRMVYGHGLVPWEYRLGIRSWVIPGALIPVVALLKLVGAGPGATPFVTALLVSSWSLTLVACGYLLGRRGAGPVGGLWAAGLVAFWPETAYFGAHLLADGLGAVPLTAAVALIYRRHPTGVQAVLAGGCLALAAMIRPQLAPAVLLAMFGATGVIWRRYVLYLVGAAPVVALFGATDWVTWGAPFISYVRYVQINGGGVAAAFGILPPGFYVTNALAVWSVGALLILATAAAGAIRLPLLAGIAVCIVVTLSLVGHKEYRFVYPALPFVLTLSGTGTGMILRRARQSFVSFRPLPSAIAAGMVWLAAAGLAATRPPLVEQVGRGVSMLRTARAVNDDPSICGVALSPAGMWHMTGHSRLRSTLTVYQRSAGDDRSATPYNALIVYAETADPQPVPPGYRARGCFHGGANLCVFVKPGGCAAVAGRPLLATPSVATQQALAKIGFAAPNGGW